MRRISLLILTFALLASACGSGSKSSSTTTTTAPTTTTTIPPADVDKTKAQAIVLTQADVGSDYKPEEEEEGDDEEESPEADQAFKDCSQNNPFLNSESEDRSAESEFNKDELTSVSSQVEFWTNEAEVKGAFDLLAQDAFATCLNGAFQKLFAEIGEGEKVAITDVQSVKKTVVAAGSDQSTGIQTSLNIAAGPIKIKLFIDMAFVRKGRAGVLFMATGANAPFPPAEQDRFVATLTQRLVANAG